MLEVCTQLLIVERTSSSSVGIVSDSCMLEASQIDYAATSCTSAVYLPSVVFLAHQPITYRAWVRLLTLVCAGFVRCTTRSPMFS